MLLFHYSSANFEGKLFATTSKNRGFLYYDNSNIIVGQVFACGPQTAPTKLRFLSRWSLWWGGVGWVGDSNVPCTCTHFWCYATGCFSLTCTHVGCYVIDFPWSRTHVRCYASDGVGWGGLGTVTFLALAHIFDATQQDVSLWLAHMLDATSLTFLGLEHMWDATQVMGWGGLGTVTFLALAHIFDATQQDVSLWLAHMLDATSLTFLGLEHMWDATQVTGWGGVGWGQ